MTIITQPLSDNEKKLFRKAFKIRVIFSILFISPLLFFIIDYVSSPYYDFEISFFPIAIIALICFLVFKYVIPFYRRSYKNLKEENKLIISTFVTNIEPGWIYSGSRQYVIQTEYRRIDPWSISILDNNPIFIFSEVYVGMPIEIHCLENNKTDILRIKKL